MSLLRKGRGGGIRPLTLPNRGSYIPSYTIAQSNFPSLFALSPPGVEAIQFTISMPQQYNGRSDAPWRQQRSGVGARPCADSGSRGRSPKGRWGGTGRDASCQHWGRGRSSNTGASKPCTPASGRRPLIPTSGSSCGGSSGGSSGGCCTPSTGYRGRSMGTRHVQSPPQAASISSSSRRGLPGRSYRGGSTRGVVHRPKSPAQAPGFIPAAPRGDAPHERPGPAACCPPPPAPPGSPLVQSDSVDLRCKCGESIFWVYKNTTPLFLACTMAMCCSTQGAAGRPHTSKMGSSAFGTQSACACLLPTIC